MNILLVTGCVPPEPCGVGHYTVRLKEALEQQGVTAVVEVIDRWGDLTRLRGRGVSVVHLMYPTRGFGRSLFPLRIPAMVRPARVVLGVHEYAAAHPLRRMFVRALARRAWRVVVSGEADRKGLAKFDPQVIPIPANVIEDPDTLGPPPAPRPNPDPIKVAFFGFPRPRKGLDTLIEACALLNGKGRRTHVRVVGQTPPELEGYRREIESLACKRGLVVEFTGGLPDPAVIEALRGADLCALPFQEGASARHATLITALQAGVPVLTTEGPEVPAGLTHGEQAWLVPPGSPAALAEGIARLADDTSVRARLGLGGTAFAREFSWPNVARAFVRLYGAR